MKEFDYNEWLASLKVGDEVCYHTRWHGYIIESIEKITPTRQIKTNRHTYKNGYHRSGNWDSHTIQPITQKVLDAMRTKEVYGVIRDYKFEKLTLEQLERVYALLQEFNPEGA